MDNDLLLLKLFPEWKMISIRNYFFIREIGILFNLPNIPLEIIDVIVKKYLNYEMEHIDVKNTCPCIKKECLVEWTSNFKIGTDLTKFQNIGHCKTKDCHTILDVTKSSKCIDCGGNFCHKCIPFEIKMNNIEFLNDNVICESCNQYGASCGGNCNQQ